MAYSKLTVQWDDKNMSNYLINFITCGFDKSKQMYWLKSYGGVYWFNYKTKDITLDTGLKTIPINVVTWRIIDEK